MLSRRRECVQRGGGVLSPHGMGVLGTGVIQDCFPFLLCQSADVDGVAVEGFSVLVSGCYFL